MSTKVHTAVQRFLVELLIIVAGVLIALAIDEWRQNLQNADLERVYLTQLISDLQATEEAILSVERVNSDSMDAVAALLTTFESNEAVVPAQLVDSLDRIIYFDNPVPVLGTVDALIATGDLRLIQDAQLRSLVTEYQSVIRDYWLAPLYQWEYRHNDLVYQVIGAAIAHGVVPQDRNGLVRQPSSTDLDGFLRNSEAYTAIIELEFVKRVLAEYRNGTRDEAVSLMRSIQQHEGPRNES